MDPAKVKAAVNVKKPVVANALHPPYLEMVLAAIVKLEQRNGSSRLAILKYITANYKLGVDEKMANEYLKKALKRGITSGVLSNSKVNCYYFLVLP